VWVYAGAGSFRGQTTCEGRKMETSGNRGRNLFRTSRHQSGGRAVDEGNCQRYEIFGPITS
jgi:hypothetical protein